MNSELIVKLMQDFLYTGLILVAPAVATSLVVGLVIALFQTLTSIQEQTLTFAPRIVAVAVVIAFSLTWCLSVMIDFTQRTFAHMGNVLQ